MKKQKKRRSWIDRLGVSENPVALIFLSAVVIFMSCVFIFQYRDYVPISRDDAQAYTGDFSHYEIDRFGRRTEYINIYMNDGTVLRMHHTCNYTDVTNALDRLDPDEEIAVLVNPASEYVIEILSEDTEILNIDEAQKRMQNDAIGFVILGTVLLCIALFAISISVYCIVRDNKKKGKRKNERCKE